MVRQVGLSERSGVRSRARRRFSCCMKLTLAGVFLPCLALGQSAKQPENRGQSGVANAQTTASSPDGNTPITQNQAAALLEEMRRLEILLSSRALSPAASNPAPEAGANSAAGPVTLSLRTAEHALGDPAAPIVMVEFADLQCPFCKDFQESTFPALDSAYIKTGRVRFVVRDLPLANHPYARPAAEAVRCAGEQGRYWELRNALLTESAPPSSETISAIAAGVHLEMKKFGECQSRHTFRPDIDAEESEAERLGINGTPAFLIGRPQDGRIVGTVIRGNRAIDVYRQEIERILNEGAEPASNLAGPSTTIRAHYDKPS